MLIKCLKTKLVPNPEYPYSSPVGLRISPLFLLGQHLTNSHQSPGEEHWMGEHILNRIQQDLRTNCRDRHPDMLRGVILPSQFIITTTNPTHKQPQQHTSSTFLCTAATLVSPSPGARCEPCCTRPLGQK